MSEFKAGDRVRIKASEAERFMPPIRRWAHEGRPATVLSNICNPPSKSPWVRVEFDRLRKPKRSFSQRENFRPSDLELIEVNHD